MSLIYENQNIYIHYWLFPSFLPQIVLNCCPLFYFLYVYSTPCLSSSSHEVLWNAWINHTEEECNKKGIKPALCKWLAGCCSCNKFWWRFPSECRSGKVSLVGCDIRYLILKFVRSSKVPLIRSEIFPNCTKPQHSSSPYRIAEYSAFRWEAALGWTCVVGCSFLCLQFCTGKALAVNFLLEQSTKINSFSATSVNCVVYSCPFAKKLSADEEVLAVTGQSSL